MEGGDVIRDCVEIEKPEEKDKKVGREGRTRGGGVGGHLPMCVLEAETWFHEQST